MTSRRPHPRTGLIAAVAVIAVWLSAALSGVRAPAPANALELHGVAAEAPPTQLPAIRHVSVEVATPVRAGHRSQSAGLGADRSPEFRFADVPRTRAWSQSSERSHVFPRRLAFRYDATAPPPTL